MPASARDTYLKTEVLTATPQKLQLMLIDGALRFIELARRHWKNDKDEEACEALIRAQRIVTELLSGLNKDVDADLAAKVASIYLYIFRTLLAAHNERDEEKLDDVVRILNIERETWRQVCEELGSENPAGQAMDRVTLSSNEPPPQPPAHQPPPTSAPIPPNPTPNAGYPDGMSSGISFEA